LRDLNSNPHIRQPQVPLNLKLKLALA